MQFRAHVAQGGSPRSPIITSVPRRHQDQDAGWRPFLILAAITLATCCAVYITLSPLFTVTTDSHLKLGISSVTPQHIHECCRGKERLELWGAVAKSGINHRFNSSAGCCNACKAMCPDDGPCLCNSWVFCGDRQRCRVNFGECWLKMQNDPLRPEVRDSSPNAMWTSGLVYGKDMGILALATEHGSIRMKLLPECAPISVSYLIELSKLRHCAGCHFYRAEGRGHIWDVAGRRVNKSEAGPPYALIQGSLDPQGMVFKDIPKEACPNIKRGMVGWIDGGPDFFISLANHEEWYPKYTVFAYVLPSDMPIVERFVRLPTTSAVWNGVTVSVLNQFVSLKLEVS